MTPAAPDSMAVPAPPKQADLGQPVSILLVDDDAKNLVALESILEPTGHHLTKAQNAEQALLALMRQNYAAIVLDVEMPDISGIDLARMIKQRKKTQHIPILFLTAHFRESEEMLLGYDVGAVDYLTKPVHPAVLRSKVSVFVDLFQKTRALADANRELEKKNIELEKRTEERLLRIQAESARAEAEAANAAKDQFLAMLSHELRTPLSPVLHGITLLTDDESCPPELRETLEMIRRNVQLEARLIDDLLDLARIHNGKIQLDLQSTNAHDLLRNVLEICRAELEAKRVDVKIRLDEGSPFLLADPARVQQIFWNLLINAIRYSSEGAVVSVITKVAPDRGAFLLEIIDSGIGIPPEKLPRIFDAFEQGLPQNGSQGLGLGLAISKTLVTLHGGTVSAFSAGPGKGSTFTVVLPLGPVFQTPRSPSSPVLPQTPTSLRLLLVEDHADTLASLRKLLVKKGFEVHAATSISAALEVARSVPFDVLVTDIGLPDGSGVELFEILRNQSDHAIHGVILSGFGTEADIARSKRAGFMRHFTKPVDFEVLHRCLLEIGRELEQGRPVEPQTGGNG